jgi:DNA (cytosine-5)-methyltransferase 1
VTRPLLIDLFCKAGGAGMGYHLAGFDVIGVDIEAQPNYPFPVVQGDALNPPLDLRRAALIHASPPCQFATAYKRRPGVAVEARSLIPQTRALLEAVGRPYVIENVDQADACGPPSRWGCGASHSTSKQRPWASTG